MSGARADLRVGGLIAAAGRSSRMGRDKALLPLDGLTFVEVMVRAFREGGASPVMVTVETLDGPVARHLESIHGPHRPDLVLENREPSLGLAGSLLTAIAAEPMDALLFSPVDAPFVNARTVRSLVDAIARPGCLAACAAFGGERGHPVVMRAALFGELRAHAAAAGARAVLDALPSDALTLVETDDPRALMNINTPADYTGAVPDPNGPDLD